MTMIMDRLAHGSLGNHRRPARRAFWIVAGAGAAIDNLVTALLDWQERTRQRRQLLALDHAALKDFGRNRSHAVEEGDKPFWRA
jgi:uncharacterized protein YjiS (DUF1127 family)